MSVGVVLGSGLGAFADQLEGALATPYAQIEGWPASTAAGHAGKLVEGNIGDSKVIVLAGRAHLYEGYTAQQVTFGIRELARRGVRCVILTNAAGAISVDYKPGELVLISDHINLLGSNPLTGANDDLLGPRFPDMSEAYPRDLREIAKQEGPGDRNHAARRDLRSRARPQLRNTRGNSLSAHHRRGSGGNVDGS